MMCPNCHLREARQHTLFGALPCDTCAEPAPTRPTPVEFTSDEVKHQRKQFFNSALQPWRQGFPSKEFVEAYPEKAKAQFGDEIAKAEYVWQGEPGWDERGESR